MGPGYTPWVDTFREQIMRLSEVVRAIFANAGLVAPRSSGLLPCVLIGRGRVCVDSERCIEKPTFETVSVEGEVEAACADLLRVGDLVDVTTRFDFVLNYGKDGLPRPCVFLVFVRIVRLKTRMELAGQVRAYPDLRVATNAGHRDSWVNSCRLAAEHPPTG